MRNWMRLFLFGFFSMGGVAYAEPTPDHEVLVIVGAAGEEHYAEGFEEAAKAWEEVREEANASITFVGRNHDEESSDREKIESWIQNLDTSASAPAWIVYIGHGTYNRRNAFLNLAGPDISANEMAEWLPNMDRTLIIIHGGSASSPFLTKLSGKNRIILSATRNPDEINYSRFGEHFSEIILNSDGDIDQDGQTSLLEAFLTTADSVEGFYQEAGRLASEHALIDDNGDKFGTPPDWFKGVRVTKRAKGGQEPDGFRAHQIALIPSSMEKLLSPEKRQQRDSLEAEIENLRKRKASLDESNYYGMLEAILVKLSEIYLSEEIEEQISSESKKTDDT